MDYNEAIKHIQNSGSLVVTRIDLATGQGDFDVFYVAVRREVLLSLGLIPSNARLWAIYFPNAASPTYTVYEQLPEDEVGSDDDPDLDALTLDQALDYIRAQHPVTEGYHV